MKRYRTERNHLHIKHLEEFTRYIQSLGYQVEPSKHAHAVLQFRLPDRSGTHPPHIIYRKQSAKEHLTIFGDTIHLVRTFYEGRQRDSHP